MVKIQKLRILLIALLVVAGFTVFSPPPAHAATSNENVGQKLIDLCADKLNVGKKDGQVAGCAYGYNLAIQGKKNASDCDDKFNGKVAQACKSTGYNLGKQDPLKIGDQGKDKDNGNKPNDQEGAAGQPGHCNSEDNCDLVKLYINPFIRLLSIIVGLVIVASLIMGGIQYSASNGDPQKASAARSRISNTLLAFLAYAFMYAFLNFLVPGGVF